MISNFVEFKRALNDLEDVCREANGACWEWESGVQDRVERCQKECQKLFDDLVRQSMIRISANSR